MFVYGTHNYVDLILHVYNQALPRIAIPCVTKIVIPERNCMGFFIKSGRNVQG